MQICYPITLLGTSANFNAVAYNGTTNYLSISALSGVANGTTGIISFWFRVTDTGATTTPHVIKNGGGGTAYGFYVEKLNASSATPYGMLVSMSSATGALQVRSSTSYQSDDGWHHLLSSWNTGFGPGSRLSSLYIDGVDVKVLNADTGVAFNTQYVNGTWNIGADGAGIQKWSGCLSEIYFAPNQYLDFSVEANRLKFRTATGQPQSLGTNGQDPTGTIPAVYIKGGATNYGVNSGTGGNFTANGTFSECGTAP